jgi:hypothetical protein
MVHNVKSLDSIIYEFRKFVHDLTAGHRNYTDIRMINSLRIMMVKVSGTLQV